jgi:hypothetical protein
MELGVSTKDLQKARQMAKRNRTSVACAPCKIGKSKCNEYRPCKKCVKSRVACIESKVYTSAKTVSSHGLGENSEPFTSRHLPQSRQIKVADVGNHSFVTPNITSLGAAGQHVDQNAPCDSLIAHPAAQYAEIDQSISNDRSANQLFQFGQPPALQRSAFIYASQQQQHPHYPLSSQDPVYLRGEGSFWTQLPMQHPISTLMLPAMQAPATLIPPAAMALLSAWSNPLSPALSPLHRSLSAIPLPPPAAHHIGS